MNFRFKGQTENVRGWGEEYTKQNEKREVKDKGGSAGDCGPGSGCKNRSEKKRVRTVQKYGSGKTWEGVYKVPKPEGGRERKRRGRGVVLREKEEKVRPV